MEDLQQLQSTEESCDEVANNETVDDSEEVMPMPFGTLGITFLCHLTEYAAIFGLSMLVLMLTKNLWPK